MCNQMICALKNFSLLKGSTFVTESIEHVLNEVPDFNRRTRLTIPRTGDFITDIIVIVCSNEGGYENIYQKCLDKLELSIHEDIRLEVSADYLEFYYNIIYGIKIKDLYDEINDSYNFPISLKDIYNLPFYIFDEFHEIRLYIDVVSMNNYLDSNLRYLNTKTRNYEHQFINIFLPNELWTLICKYLELDNVLKLSYVNKYFYKTSYKLKYDIIKKKFINYPKNKLMKDLYVKVQYYKHKDNNIYNDLKYCFICRSIKTYKKFVIGSSVKFGISNYYSQLIEWIIISIDEFEKNILEDVKISYLYMDKSCKFNEAIDNYRSKGFIIKDLVPFEKKIHNPNDNKYTIRIPQNNNNSAINKILIKFRKEINCEIKIYISLKNYFTHPIS